MHALDVPIFVSAIVFVGIAAVSWRHAPLCARVCLGVATAFAIAGLQHPGLSIEELLGQPTRDGMTYMVAAARVTGFVSAMAAVTILLRNFATR